MYSVSNSRPLRLLDRDDAVLADLLHHLGDQLADLASAAEMVATWAISSLPLTGGGHLLELLDEGGRSPRSMPRLSSIGVGAGGDVAQALVHDRLGQHGRGRGAVAGDIVGLGRGFLEELGAHVLERVLELDLLGDGHAVVGDGRRAVLLVERHVAALRAEGGLDRVGEDVDALFEGLRAPSALNSRTLAMMNSLS